MEIEHNFKQDDEVFCRQNHQYFTIHGEDKRGFLIAQDESGISSELFLASEIGLWSDVPLYKEGDKVLITDNPEITGVIEFCAEDVHDWPGVTWDDDGTSDLFDVRKLRLAKDRSLPSVVELIK